MSLKSIRHRWPEKPGIIIHRPVGHKHHTFLHFIRDAKITINGEEKIAPSGSCIFITRGVPQHYGSNTGLLHDWMHYGDKTAKIYRDMGIEENELITLTNGLDITKIMSELEYEFLSNRKYSDEIIGLKLHELFYTILRSSEPFENIKYSSQDIKTLTAVRENMMLNIDDNWTTSKLANSAQMSHSKFHSIYKAYFGISPIDDLINARIQSAKETLLSENITIKELSQKLGYADVTHFIRQFTSKVGISPKQYALKNSLIK